MDEQLESRRLAALKSLCVLDSAPSVSFDRITALAADLFDAPIALVSLVDADRQWFKSRQGLDAVETPRAWAFCDHAIRQGPHGFLVVPDATQDARFADNPLVTGFPDIRFYTGATLTTADGLNIGTLCVIDTVARPAPSARDLARLGKLAGMVVNELESDLARRVADRKHQMLDLAETMAGVGSWRYDPATGSVDWSNEVYRIHGVDQATFDPNLGSALDFYHPDDRPIVSQHLTASIETGSGFEFRLRVLRPDGEVRHVLSKAASERGPTGAIIALNGVFQDVTESQNLLDRSKRNEARHRLLADNMADVVTRIRPDGSSSYISPAIEHLLGFTPAEMRGKGSTEFVHADDRALVNAAFGALTPENPRKTVQHRAIHKDGTVVWVETSLQRVAGDTNPTGDFVAVIRDLTASRALEAAISESEARFRTLAENSPDVLMRVGRDGLVTYVSPACRRMGIDPDEVIGRPSTDFVLPEYRAAAIAAQEAMFAGGEINRSDRRERPVVGANGETVWFEGSPQLVRDESGQVTEIVNVFRDVTIRREAEVAMAEAKRAAETANEAKSQFLANMSHELRTPLTSIIGFSGLLDDQTDLSPTAKKYAGRILSAGRGLLALINDVLDYSKLEEGQVILDPHACDIGSTAEDVLDLLSVQAGAKGLALTLRLGEDVPSWVNLDELRLRQVLQNLIGNAVKFTSEGGVSVSLETPAPGRLRFAVKDTGPGISAAYQASLFDRFSQADAGITRKFGGSGLGLSICKNLVALMGGEIGVASAPGKGSTFWFEILAEACAPPDVPEERSEAAVPRLDRMKVLVVDDHEHNRALVTALLTPLGVDVQQAVGGSEAIEACLTTRFDLIFMDVQMPGTDGRLATRGIRATSTLNNQTPILALTAMSAAVAEADLFACGMNDVVAKPINPAALIGALNHWVSAPNEDNDDDVRQLGQR